MWLPTVSHIQQMDLLKESAGMETVARHGLRYPSPSPYPASGHLRGVGGKLLSALALTAACSTAQALEVRFDGLIQFSSGGPHMPIVNNLFQRQWYRFAGARITFQPWRWDPEEQAWI